MLRLSTQFCCLAFLILSPGAACQTCDAADVELRTYLTEGRLGDAAIAMQAAVDADPADQEARFSLGIVRFLQAVEGLGQDQYRYGLAADRAPAMVFLRLPIPVNPKPDEISYGAARDIIQRMADRLAAAEQTLAQVRSPAVRLELPIDRIRLDLDGNGHSDNSESLGHIIEYLQSRPRRRPEVTEPAGVIVGFDVADAVWLRGYCHALSAIAEMILAYDWQDQFERTAHLLYPRVNSPYKFLSDEGPGAFVGFGAQNVLDVVAVLHTINYEVAEPSRMNVALRHWEDVIRLSRESWDRIQQETDDADEWIPGPDQTAVITDLRVGRELVTSWQAFLDEIEQILQGKKLVPFWRGIPGGINNVNDFPRHPTLGVNVRRIFTEPGRFDLALWLQGTGMQPWLEEGEIVDPDQWAALMSGFDRNFWQVFFWFN